MKKTKKVEYLTPAELSTAMWILKASEKYDKFLEIEGEIYGAKKLTDKEFFPHPVLDRL